MTNPGSIEKRLWGRVVEQPNGCREFTGATNDRGYGRIMFNGKRTLTHRAAWGLANGPIPLGMKVLHHCDNPSCCQTDTTAGFPDGHLFLGTAADNTADMIAKGRKGSNTMSGRTHCPENHPYDEENTYVYPDGSRDCRICRRARRLRAAS